MSERDKEYARQAHRTFGFGKTPKRAVHANFKMEYCK